MADVTCKYCKRKFNKKNEPYVQIPIGKTFRHGHAECYKKALKDGIEKNQYEIIDPKTQIICCFCKKPIQEETYKTLKNKFAHISCWEEDQKKEKTPKEKLYNFIIEQTSYDFVPPSMQKLIENYIKKYNFTYSGIQGTLRYWYIIKQNSIDRENILAIVPYVYDDARQFYKQVYESRQKNAQNLNNYIEQTEIIKIAKPVLKGIKKTEFSFLDEEEDGNVNGK